MTSSNSTTTDWHMYFHGVDREDFPDYPDDHFGPKAGYAYQHDATNDEYHSILSNPAAVSLLEQVKAGKTLDPARLLHFTDAHLPVLAELLQHNWLASKDDDAKEVMACVAYRHHADFENPSVAALLLAHLYGMGATDEDIVSFIENTDEIDDDTNFVKLLNTAKQQIIR
ncbi:hypothetical protein [Comamonas suwonensis]|jgi:hypothetical protein|uniref:Uncharacterized protein n=1 Tax=Comamonas suwonensis TaxID=2606214 RepID=A0A843B399_9BURK|nr:hypothetical protein [Comamonas suwonensis]MBI1625916.1 hypothetical protein [Comamonas suwonensis]